MIIVIAQVYTDSPDSYLYIVDTSKITNDKLRNFIEEGAKQEPNEFTDDIHLYSSEYDDDFSLEFDRIINQDKPECCLIPHKSLPLKVDSILMLVVG